MSKYILLTQPNLKKLVMRIDLIRSVFMYDLNSIIDKDDAGIEQALESPEEIFNLIREAEQEDKL